jgi:hypothetical protein
VQAGNIGFQVDSIIKLSDRSYILVLREQVTDAPQTGLKPIVEVKSFSGVDASSITASDGAGPVLWRVEHSPSAPMANATSYFDTLRITLSEPVRCDAVVNGSVSSSFRYYDGTDGYSQQAFSNSRFAMTCSTAYTDEFTIIVPSGFTITPGKDSLQFVGPAADSAGNVAPPGGRKARIVSGPGSVDVVMTGGVMVIRRNNATDPFAPSVKQFYNEVIGSSPSGMIIGISVRTTLEPQPDGTYGKMIIYDAVGNIVRDDIAIKKAGTSKDFGSLWDGKNRSGRYVGSGGYLGVARVRPVGSEKMQTIRIKIGVKRE